MLYNLLYPLSVDYSILNIFKYITFRSAWALVTALAVSILVGPYFIRWLQAIKCRQEILKEVKAHQCKAGTPTMGGLLIVFAVSVSVLLWADLTNAYVWMTMLVFIGFSAVGFIDDFMKVSHHQNKGCLLYTSGRGARASGRSDQTSAGKKAQLCLDCPPR